MESENPRASKLADATSCERPGGTSSKLREENKSLRRTNGRTKTMEPICSAPPSLLSFSFYSFCPYSLFPFLLSFTYTLLLFSFSLSLVCLSVCLSLFSRFSTHQPNLCYLLVTFIWSPRVLDLSLGLLSHSPSAFFPSPFSLPLFLYIYLSLSLAIAYQQPAASNSPELLIPDFRPVGKALTPFLLVLLFLLLFLWPRRSPAAPPPGPSYQG